jgi:hypothetical protein
MAGVAQIELLQIDSFTLTDREFLTGHGTGKAVTISGELRLPTPGGCSSPSRDTWSTAPAVYRVTSLLGLTNLIRAWSVVQRSFTM